MTDNIVEIDTEEVKPTKIEDTRCAPGIQFDGISCMPLSLIISAAEAFNEVSSNKIKLHHNLEVLNPRKYKKYLIKEMNSRNDCDSQQCWKDKKFISSMKQKAREELLKYTWRPPGPTGKNEWLNTLHINDTMRQYEKLYPSFKYLGTVPADFDDIPQLGIKNLDLTDMKKKGKTQFGIVFNLDESHESGSHWNALYINSEKGQVYFFDSYGSQPEPRVRKLMRRISKYYQDTGKPTHADYNKVRHQYENSECGVYSINFILRMLKGEEFNNICDSKVPDEKINKCRNIYFRNTRV